MKKGLLLSVIASTMIFAGGDIAPVEPAAAAPKADCSDFYGSVGAYYQSQQADSADLFDTTAGVGATAFSVVTTLGVEKNLFGAIGFGAEVSGWSSLGMGEIDNNIGARVPAGTMEGGQLSELFLTASFGNTAAKFGRFAAPASLSPFAWTDSWAGVKDVTFEGVMLANTDVEDTTLYGAYIMNLFAFDTRTAIGADEGGLFAAGFVNKSIENTTISAVGYYVPDAAILGEDLVAAFATVNSKLGNIKVDLQAGYVDVAETVDLDDATYAAGARVSGSFGAFDASLAASYVNDGSASLSATSALGNPVGGYWLYTAGEENAQLDGLATTAIQAKISTKVGIGKLFGRVATYTSTDGAGAQTETSLGARIGYSFKVAGIATSVQYRFRSHTSYDDVDTDRHRVRVQAVYKF